MMQHGSYDHRGLGIDLGSRKTKALLVRQVADRVNVEAAATFPFDGLWSLDGVIRDPKAVGLALRERLRASGISHPFAVIAVPSHLATLRWVNLPPLTGNDLRDAASYKVKRHLPFSVADAYVEATEPDVEPGAQVGPSLAIVVKKDVVDSRAEVLEHAGIVPVSAELEAQAILRVIGHKLNEKSPLYRDASVTIIDLGSANTHMYVVQNRQLQFMRGIRFGTGRIASGIASATGIAIEDVEEALGREGAELAPDGMLTLQLEGQPVRANIHADLDKLTLEFLRLLRYFRSLHPERSYAGILDHVIVCGGLSGLRGFAEYLHQALGLHVEQARPFAGMVGRFKREAFESVVNRQEAYTVVLGLALSSLDIDVSKRSSNHASREFVWTR